MRKILFLSVMFCLALMASFGMVSAQDGSAIEVTCPNGQEITNGVEFIVNMRPGFTYTATALGIDGFDPVLAVMDRGQVRGCSDDSQDAGEYTANLPTTGAIPASFLNSQLPFSHNYSGFEDVSLIVGDFSGSNGEFLLIIEGMSVTARDGAGDPFKIQITENITNSTTDISAYMMATNDQLDTLMQVVDADGDVVFSCDDAGTSLCEENTSDLSSSTISRTLGRETPPRNLNSMLTLPTAGAVLDFTGGVYIDFLMTSFRQTSTGDYLVAFHVGVDDGTGVTAQQADPDPTPRSDSNIPGNTVAGGGIDLTCPSGQQISNGVEVAVNMRPGFTYTATVVGVDGFDPVLAVVNRGEVFDCNDDSSDAATYEVNLPSTGRVGTSRFNSQLPFSHTFDGFEDISLVVGGFGGSVGEFVLILEGMAVTSADGSGANAGDPFRIRLTPNIVNATIDATVYMIGVDASVNPLVRLVDPDSNEILSCDDAGNTNRCSAGSLPMDSAFVTRNNGRFADADESDSMLVIPTTTLTDVDFSQDLSLRLLMTSFSQDTFGEYLVAFHMGFGDEVVDADL